MIQNKDIENAGKCNPSLDEEAKNDLRRNHFVFGNAKPNFETTFRTEFYDKSGLLPKDIIIILVMISLIIYLKLLLDLLSLK